MSKRINRKRHISTSDSSSSDSPPIKTPSGPKKSSDNIITDTPARRESITQTMTPTINMKPSIIMKQLPNVYLEQLKGTASPLPEFSGDEQAEKRKRQQERILAQGRSPANMRRSSIGLTKAAAGSGFNAKDIKENYVLCLKLSATNKINTKNAFGLYLIDYMSELLKNNNNNGQMNFKLASSALDAGAKIYCHRVDKVHADAQIVASGLVMALDDDSVNNQPKNPDHENENEDDENQEGEAGKQKKKKTVRRNCKVIATNIESLNMSKVEQAIQVDPVFHHLSSVFDMGQANGLLMANLKINSYHELLIESEDHFDVLDEITINNQSVPFDFCVDNLKQFENCQICPKLSTFEFNNRSEPTNINMMNIDEDDDTKTQKSCSNVFDLNAEATEEMDDPPPPSGFDPSDESHCEDNDQAPDFVETITKKSIMKAVNLEEMSDLLKILSDQPSEYSYFNRKLLGTWAGPTHWKTNPFFRMNKAKDDLLGVKTKRVKKQYEEKDYLKATIDETDCVKGIDIKLKRTTLKKWLSNDLHLPQDYNFDPVSLAHPFCKKGTTFRTILQPSITDSTINTDTHSEMGGDFADARAEGFMNHDDDDDHDYPTESGFPTSNFADTEHGPTQDDILAFTGTNLIDEPYLIQQFHLPFAKYAKKMDVKKLKRAIWDILNTEELTSPTITSEIKSSQSKQPFSQLYDSLPRKITPVMATNLSAPIAFVTLLHIVNEKNLILSGREDLTDFIIEGED